MTRQWTLLLAVSLTACGGGATEAAAPREGASGAAGTEVRTDPPEPTVPECADRAALAMLPITVSHGRLLVFCARCGEQPDLGRATRARVTSEDGVLVVDGVPHELADLYLEVSPSFFENVALRVGCGARGAPAGLRFDADGLAHEEPLGPIAPTLGALGWGPTETHFGVGHAAE